MGAYFELWRTWEMFIKHTKVLAILYAEAYKRGKVPLVFYKGVMSTKHIFEKTIGEEKSIEEKLKSLSYHELGPVNLFELNDTLEEFESDTYEELRRKLKHTKEPIPQVLRAYFRECEKRYAQRAKKK